MKRNIIAKMLFPSIVVGMLAVGIIAVSCGGSNPAFAPFGSEVLILNPPGDITIPPNSLEPRLVQAQVLDPEGLPLNDVRVIWTLSFANENSLVVDTNGDGVSDARALQLVNDHACQPQRCLSTPITEWFEMGAFVDSPFDILTDNRGVAFVVILVSGDVIVDPATLEASTDSGSVDVVEFSVNADVLN
jgi:hypothetical protein